jgi:hypothetical protein
MKARSIAACISVLIAAGINMQAQAGANDFFGSSLGSASGPVGGSPDTQQGGASAVNAVPTTAPAGDYTSDEKRVQKKFKSSVDHARKLVARGEAMMKSKDDKECKKGKILKEIGERRISELKANNPFPEIAGREPKKLPN